MPTFTRSPSWRTHSWSVVYFRSSGYTGRPSSGGRLHLVASRLVVARARTSLPASAGSAGPTTSAGGRTSVTAAGQRSHRPHLQVVGGSDGRVRSWPLGDGVGDASRDLQRLRDRLRVAEGREHVRRRESMTIDDQAFRGVRDVALGPE